MPEWVTPTAAAAIAIAFVTALWKGARWTGKIDAEIGGLKDLVKEIRDKLDRAFQAIPSNTVVGSSPVRLTDLGERIAEETDARAWAVSHAETLLPKCEELKEYQIYNLCTEYVMSRSAEWPENMDEVAYNHATVRDNLWDVLAVVLRDAILNRLQDKG